MFCRPKPYLYKTDHTYPRANTTDVPVVILYAEIGTKRFSTFHKLLSGKAAEGTIVYVLRHFVAVSSDASAPGKYFFNESGLRCLFSTLSCNLTAVSFFCSSHYVGSSYSIVAFYQQILSKHLDPHSFSC